MYNPRSASTRVIGLQSSDAKAKFVYHDFSVIYFMKVAMTRNLKGNNSGFTPTIEMEVANTSQLS